MGIASAAIIVICAVSGLHKGLVGKLNMILAVILSALLVNLMLPYVTNAIRTHTPLYSVILQQCDKVLSTNAVKNAIASISGTSSGTSSGTASSGTTSSDTSSDDAGAGSTLNRDAVRSLMSQYGLDTSQLDYLSDSEIEQLLQQYGLDTSQLFSSENLTNVLNSLTRIEQTRLIQNLPVPEFMQKLMISYNNSEGYNKLQVTDFGGYIMGFIASLILNVLAFIITMLIVWLIVKAILAAVNIAARLPAIGTVNKVLGLCLGILQGVIIVWLIYAVISLFSGTQIGLNMLSMIRSSALAYPLYQSDVFLKIITNSLENIL